MPMDSVTRVVGLPRVYGLKGNDVQDDEGGGRDKECNSLINPVMSSKESLQCPHCLQWITISHGGFKTYSIMPDYIHPWKY